MLSRVAARGCRRFTLAIPRVQKFQRRWCNTEPPPTGGLEMLDVDEDLDQALAEMDLTTVQLLPVMKGLGGSVHGDVKLSDQHCGVILGEALRRVREAAAEEVVRELQLFRQLFSEAKRRHDVGRLSYSALVEACASAANIELTQEYLAEAEEQGLLLTPSAWNAAAVVLVSGEAEDSAAFIRRMRQGGVDPDGDTAASLLCALREGHRGAEALGLLRSLRRNGEPKEGMCEVEPRHFELALQAMVGHFADTGQWSRLVDTVHTMMKGGMQLRVAEELPSVIAAGVRRTRATESKEEHAAAFELACSAWDYVEKQSDGQLPPLGCVHALLRLCEVCGAVERAEGVIAKLREAGVEPTDVMLEHLSGARKATEP
eukprot:Hpha_TRINITY_DN15145_c0_g7::TRINITY_DN15145_c0_g7_i1::g.126844::m.126844